MSQQSKPAWAANLMPVGLNYYTGIVENAEDLLECHKVATQSSFGTRSSTKKPDHQNAVHDKENHEEPVSLGSASEHTYINPISYFIYLIFN